MDGAACHVCALVAYDGTAYHGFQAQANASTIQGTLETALDRFAARTDRVVGAGRTDAGVHASGQVVAVHLQWRHGLDQLQRAWNVHLPKDVVVRQLREAKTGFHPRFSASSRTYAYTVVQGQAESRRVAAQRSPLVDRFALYETRALDTTAMQAAADLLVGCHDFGAFGQPTQGEITIRNVLEARWTCEAANASLYPGRRLVFTITASGFLRQMVRNLVGCLLAVGRGEWSAAQLAQVLVARDRSRSAPPAAARGLVLERVTYPAVLDPWQQNLE